MSKPKSLTDKIFDIVSVANKPMTAAEVRRALPDNVEKDEVSSRLTKLAKRCFLFSYKTNRQASTGPRIIKCYSVKPIDDNYYQHGNMFQDLLQTQ